MSHQRRPVDPSAPNSVRTAVDTAAAPGEALAPGTHLEQFRIRAPLGQGGMGVVYAAEDTLLRRSVAIKVLPRPAGGDDPELARLLREARAVARLDHAHVVRIYHVGQWAGGYYLVLELMAGGDLQSRINDQTPLPWPEATRAAADACRGLAAAHAAGFLHRDVKPSNLMRDANGRVKLADFGLVRGGDLTASTAHHLAGTPAFMSPEQCRGEPTDERSDLYALGATYFVLLTGRPPFVGDTAVQVMFAHCTAPVPDPCAAVPDLPPACAAVVRKGMAKQPADRFQSADEMLAALEAVVWPGNVPAQSPRERRPRHRGLLVASGMGLVLVAALVAGFVVGNRREHVADRDRGVGPSATGAVAVEGSLDDPYDPAIPPGGRVIRVGGQVRAVAFSPDGRWFATGSADVPLGATVWARATGKVHRRLWRGKVAHCLNFTRTLEGLQRGGDDGAVIFHLNEDKEYPYPVNPCRVQALAMPKDGSIVSYGIGSGEHVGEVHQHWYPGGNNLPRLVGPTAPVEQLAFSPYDDTLAVVHQGGTVALWEARQGKPLRNLPVSSPGVAAAPNGPVLAIVFREEVGFWNYRSHQWAGPAVRFRKDIRALAYTPDGKYLAVGDVGGDVTLWDTVGGAATHTFHGHRGPILGLAVSPDGGTLASGGGDGTARLWDLRGAITAARREQP